MHSSQDASGIVADRDDSDCTKPEAANDKGCVVRAFYKHLGEGAMKGDDEQVEIERVSSLGESQAWPIEAVIGLPHVIGRSKPSLAFRHWPIKVVWKLSKAKCLLERRQHPCEL